MSDQYNNQKILISGHRGTRVHEIENTEKAFEFCIKNDFDYIEFDVKKTQDNEIIVFHDRKVDKLLNSKGIVENISLKDLKELQYEDGQRIQTLEEFFQQIGKNIKPMLEIKSRDISNQVMDLVHKFGFQGDEILIQSFFGRDIRQCYEIDPQYDYGLCMAYLGKLPLFKKTMAKIFYKKFIEPHPFIKWLNLDGPFIYDEFIDIIIKKGHHIILGANNTHKYLKNIEKWNIEIINCDDGLDIKNRLKKMKLIHQ